MWQSNKEPQNKMLLRPSQLNPRDLNKANISRRGDSSCLSPRTAKARGLRLTSSLSKLCVVEWESLCMLTYRPAHPTWSQSTLHLLRGDMWALPEALGQKEELGVEQIKKPGHAQHSRCIGGCSLPGLLNTYLAPVRSLFLLPPNMTSLSTKRQFHPPLLYNFII